MLLLSTIDFKIPLISHFLLGGKTFSDQTICYVRKEGVPSGWEQEFPKISLAIPPKTFPTLISCKCIAVLYFILVSRPSLKYWSWKKEFGFGIQIPKCQEGLYIMFIRVSRGLKYWSGPEFLLSPSRRVVVNTLLLQAQTLLSEEDDRAKKI